MTVKYFFLFGFLLVFQSFYGQIDEKDLQKMSYDELYDLYFDYKNNLIQQKKIADFYTNKGLIENIGIEIARGYYLLSFIDRDVDKNKSISYLDSVIKYSYNSNDKYFPIVAYNVKAFLYTQLMNYEKTISCYLEAEKYTKDRNNLDGYYDIRHRIGIFKSENLGEIEEALELYKECKHYYTKRDLSTSYYSRLYLGILFSLADAHKSIKNIDSASYYNKLGYRHAKLSNDNYRMNWFVLNEGANRVEAMQYSIALDSIKKGYSKMVENNDTGNILASFYYFGKCYEGMGNKELAIKYYKKVDSMYQKKKFITPEFIGGYQYLISYYKQKEDKTNQLKYLNILMKIDSTLQKGYKKWNKLLKDKYDFPHLVEDKENLINDLNNDKKSNFRIIILLIILIGLTLFFGIRETHLKKVYKKRFENIVNTNEIEEVEINKDESTKTTSNVIGIADEIVEMILKELKNFEKNKGYLNSTTNIQNLAQEFDTNSKYLSIVINAKKEKSFTQYINDLRIDNIINELKTNKNLRKFTMTAIAEEAGFNTAESFSKAFLKKTGLKPSYFIKELSEM